MIQKTLEGLIESERFKMPELYAEVWPFIEAHEPAKAHLEQAKTVLGPLYKKLGVAILRHVFLIELVKVPAIETTKMRVRWFAQLNGDPRWCSYDECLRIAVGLLDDLILNWIPDPESLECLRLFLTNGILPYEAPIDYIKRPLDGKRIHRLGNVAWTCTETMLRTMKLRAFLRDSRTSPAARFFGDVLEDKVKVKTYLTDRVLTGDHKTNREKRWETHPESVHFAYRRDCMAIEYTLIEQLCQMEGFPEEYRQSLQEQGILPVVHEPFRCPITLEPMSFVQFKTELENPTHGKSSFQVGHLNPLKLGDPAGAASGHTSKNISWISADGNRIQGSLSLAAVRSLLRSVASNYEARNWLD